MTRILVVTKFLPLPANTGGRKRSLAILQRLVNLGDVTLCAYDDGACDVAALEAMGVEVVTTPWRPRPVQMALGAARSRSASAARFYEAKFIAMVESAAARAPVDLLHVEYVQLAPFVDHLRARVKVLDLPDVASNQANSYATGRGALRGLPYRVEALALTRMERRVRRGFDVTVVVSELERTRLAPGGEVLVCPNGWDPGPSQPVRDGRAAVFVALMGWPPNAQAARWLLDTVWPKVVAALPDARLLLVGKNPPQDLAERNCPGVDVIGEVPQVEPYLAQATIALAPLRAGGGTRLKILEALDAGRPVVATTVGAEGLEDLVGDGVVVADEPAEFADEMVRLLADPEQAAVLGRRGNSAVAERHSWKRSLEPLVTWLNQRMVAPQVWHLGAYLDSQAFGGAEMALARTVSSLPPGTTTTVFTTNPQVRARMAAVLPGVRFVDLEEVRGKWDVVRILTHIHKLRAARLDVLHVNLWHPWAGHYAIGAGLVLRIPIVIMLHAYLDPSSTFSRALTTRLFRRATAVAVSEDLARRVEASARLDRGQIRVVYNGIKPRELGPRRAGVIEGGMVDSADTCVVGVAARLSEEKQVDFAIRAMADVERARLVIVGDGPHRPYLEALASELGMWDRVTFVGWVEDVYEHLDQMDVYVGSARYEAFGLALAEAMMAALPVVATDVGGAREVIAAGETGFLVDGDDPAAMAKVLQSLVDDPEMRACLGRAGRERVLERFTLEEAARSMTAIYKRAANIVG